MKTNINEIAKNRGFKTECDEFGIHIVHDEFDNDMFCYIDEHTLKTRQSYYKRISNGDIDVYDELMHNDASIIAVVNLNGGWFHLYNDYGYFHIMQRYKSFTECLVDAMQYV